MTHSGIGRSIVHTPGSQSEVHCAVLLQGYPDLESSMTDVAIRVQNLCKQYRIGARQAGYKTLRESLMEAVEVP